MSELVFIVDHTPKGIPYVSRVCWFSYIEVLLSLLFQAIKDTYSMRVEYSNLNKRKSRQENMKWNGHMINNSSSLFIIFIVSIIAKKFSTTIVVYLCWKIIQHIICRLYVLRHMIILLDISKNLHLQILKIRLMP